MLKLRTYSVTATMKLAEHNNKPEPAAVYVHAISNNDAYTGAQMFIREAAAKANVEVKNFYEHLTGWQNGNVVFTIYNFDVQELAPDDMPAKEWQVLQTMIDTETAAYKAHKN